MTHTIYRRQENMIEMQVEVMSDIARTFNQCVCGVPPTPQKGMALIISVMDITNMSYCDFAKIMGNSYYKPNLVIQLWQLLYEDKS